MKRIVSSLLACVVLVSVLCVSVVSTAAAQGEYQYSTVTSDTAVITGYTGAGGDVTFPTAIDGYRIIGISKKAFYQNTNIDNLTIPSGISSIGEAAFAGSYITSVSVPDTVTDIGARAFSSCVYLTKAELDCRVKVLPVGCFSTCTRLVSIALPQGMSEIGDGAFEKCSDLSSVNLPDSIEKIGKYAFSYNFALKSIKLNNGLITLDEAVFYYSPALESVVIPSSVRTIGKNAFYFCTGLAEVTLNEGLDTIGDNAFDSCPLKTLRLPKSVKQIGDYAFGYYYDEEAFDYRLLDTFSAQCVKDSASHEYAEKNSIPYSLYSSVLIGDVNLDTNINIKDATAIQKHIASLEILTGDALAAADFDRDGVVNVRDATAIQKFIAGIV